MSKNPNRIQFIKSKNAHRPKGLSPWNKGLTASTNESVARGAASNSVARPHLVGKHHHSNELKQKLSRIAKSRGLGGYQMGSGRGIKGWYKGIFCDSSWELAYVIYCLDHNYSIRRNTVKYTYEYEGKSFKYLPDFIVNGNLVEIKGWRSARTDAKIRGCTDPLIVLYENDLQHVFQYVKQKYGNNFIKLYIESKPDRDLELT